MILDREIYFSNSFPKRIYLFLKKFFYILFRFLGRPNWGRLQAGEKVLSERQFLKLNANPQGELLCTSCQLCVEVCPTRCLIVELPENKTFPSPPEVFEFQALECIYCDLCVDVCPEDAIEFSSDHKNTHSSGTEKNNLIELRANSLS